MSDHRSLRPRDRDGQRFACGCPEFDDVCAVALGSVDHDSILAARGSHTHRQRSFPQSSSASRLTAGAAGFLLLTQWRERDGLYRNFRLPAPPSSSTAAARKTSSCWTLVGRPSIFSKATSLPVARLVSDFTYHVDEMAEGLVDDYCRAKNPHRPHVPRII
jgi:hypothetical protein